MPPQRSCQNSTAGCSTDAQVAASNQTLNAWVRGRHHPWMNLHLPQATTPGPHPNQVPTHVGHSAGRDRMGRPPSRPRERPESDNSSQSARVTHAAVSAPTASPSNASHEKPMATPEPGSKETPDGATALPSPAPTDQPSPPAATPNSPCQTRRSEVQSPGPSHHQVPGLSNNTAAGIHGIPMKDQDQAPTAYLGQSPRPAAVVVVPDEATTQPVASAAPHSFSRFSPRGRDSQLPSFTTSPSCPINTADSSAVAAPPATQATPTLASVPEPRLSHSLPSGPAVVHPSYTAPGAVHAQPANPQPAATSTSPATQIPVRQSAYDTFPDDLRLDVMSQNLARITRLCNSAAASAVASRHGDHTTLPRLNLLKEAVQKCDYFYIVLHQILCLWSIDRDLALSLFDVPHSAVEGGLDIVQHALRRNDNILPDHVVLFARFPGGGPNSTLWRSHSYRTCVQDVGNFLLSLHNQWNQFWVPNMKAHQGRGYPIMADELRIQLRMRSPILQSIFFTVTRRNMGISDGPIADQMGKIFQRDMLNDNPNIPPQNKKFSRQELIFCYKQLVTSYHQSNYGYPVGSQPPMLPSTAGPTGAPREQHMMDQIGRNATAHPGMQNGARNPYALHMVAADMYPSPSVVQHSPTAPHNSQSMSAQFTLRPNSNLAPRQGTQTAMQPSMARVPHVAGRLMQQPLTPAGSPLHANIQLPNAGRTAQAPGQTSPVLQAPPGGLSVSMPIVTSPTRTTAAQRMPGHSPNGPAAFPSLNAGLQGPHPLMGHQVGGHQPALNEYMRQVIAMGLQQNRANAPTAVPNMVAPQQMQQTRSSRDASQQRQSRPTNVGHAMSFSQRPSTTRPRGITGSSGALFRPPHQQVPLDQMPHTPYEPKALIMGLHQADVRSPRRVPRELPMAGDATLSPERHYQSIRRLAAGPIATEPCCELHHLSFVVSHSDLEKLSPSLLPIGEQIPVSQYFNGSLRYRLRLCELPVSQAEQKTVPEPTWAVGQTYWPGHINIMVNNQAVKIRRKQHNGQHQPVELASYLVGGVNTISIAVLPQSRAQRRPNMVYFTAVEVIETLSHRSVVDLVRNHGVLPAESTRKRIQDRLRPAREDGGDDDVIMDGDLSIDVTDPFTSKIFEIPVRGATCTHMECFDLGKWLETRPSKPKCTYHGAGDKCLVCRGPDLGPEPSLPDKWKCPLCDKDARPDSLRLDMFMVEVRARLEKERKLHTKMICVGADGSWKPKIEEEGEDDDDDGDDAAGVDGQPPAKRARTGATTQQSEAASAIEIIELD